MHIGESINTEHHTARREYPRSVCARLRDTIKMDTKINYPRVANGGRDRRVTVRFEFINPHRLFRVSF